MMKSAFILSLIILASSCTKQASKDSGPVIVGDAESYAISNSKLKNCHFKDPNPTYAMNSTITPNVIQCDEGVPTAVQVLTPALLPDGLHISESTLALTGKAGERVVQAPYDVYLENESGYVIIKITISIQ